jgi:hypothetical protein
MFSKSSAERAGFESAETAEFTGFRETRVRKSLRELTHVRGGWSRLGQVDRRPRSQWRTPLRWRSHGFPGRSLGMRCAAGKGARGASARESNVIVGAFQRTRLRVRQPVTKGSR